MRWGRQAIAAIGIAMMTMGASTPSYADALTVKIAQGKVHGKTINDGKVKAFLGLPYAAPPLGDLRWKAPEPAGHWKGMRDATQYGARCYQAGNLSDQAFQDGGQSEDCLFLNVYTPAEATAKSKAPVMVWIHGGGYATGSGSEPRHNGDFLAAKGVVLVTFNYRLGVMGFLATSELAKEANGAAGNYGLLDMVAALQWVHANIADFGGDPGNVTIFGESAGSYAVSTLMASPLAQGLFQKAIGESGGAFGGILPTDTLDAREERDEEWATSLGAPTLNDLRKMPIETLIDAGKRPHAPKFNPVVDGRLLTEPVPQVYAEGKQAHIPLLAGWNRDENSNLSNNMTADRWKSWASAHFGDRADAFTQLYPGTTDEQAIRSAIDYSSDGFIAFGTWQWIEAQRKTSDAPIYRYHFEQPAPPSRFHPGGVTFHADDIEYVFGTLDTRPDSVWTAKERTLSEQMMSYWTNFAKTGDPNGPGLPAWPKYGADKQVLHLDTTITSSPSTVEDRYEFLLTAMPASGR